MGIVLLFFAALLAAIAVVSLRYQVRNWRRLRTETLASDDRRYLRGVCQRRALNAVLMFALAGMLAGAYFTGGLAELVRLARQAQADPPVLTDEDRETVKSLSLYWIGVLGLLFFVIVVAIADSVAVSLYGRQQLRRIQHEQRDLLERDLAMIRQQKLNDRERRLE
jgi:hypothetical protein